MTLCSGKSVVISSASVNERIHSSSSNCFVVGSSSFLRNVGCVLSKKRHSSGKSSVAHVISYERDDGIQVFLPFTSGPRSMYLRQFDVWQRSDTCFAPSPRQFVVPSTPGGSRRLGALRTGGMRSNARADGSSSCQSTGSLPTLFVCLRLRLPCCCAERPSQSEH